MLPDYPEHKAALMKLLREIMHAHINGQGILREIPQTIIAEGLTHSQKRGDDTAMDIDFFRAEGRFSIGDEEMDTITPLEVINRVRAAADHMKAEIERSLFKAVDHATQETGNVLQAKGPLTPDDLFRIISMVQIEFRRDGKMDYHFVAGPNMYKQMVQVFKEIEAHPALMKQFNDIISKKKEEWHAREANRKLVG